MPDQCHQSCEICEAMSTRDDHGSRKSDAAYTADRGRILVEEELGGLLWRGRQLRPRERPLVVAVKELAAASGKDMLDRWAKFETPGIAPLAYLGFPDGVSTNPEELREMKKRGKSLTVLLAEVRPDGLPLAGVVEEEGLTKEEVVRIGLALCDTAIAWIEKRGSATAGFRPETIYIGGDIPGERFYAGCTPRVFAMIGNGGNDGTFPTTYYGAPLAASATQIDAHDITFAIGCVLWFASTREHPVRHIHVIEHARPDYTGPKELGEILRVAIRLYEERISVQELRASLLELAKKWKVEPAPFPPPGLAD